MAISNAEIDAVCDLARRVADMVKAVVAEEVDSGADASQMKMHAGAALLGVGTGLIAASEGRMMPGDEWNDAFMQQALEMVDCLPKVPLQVNNDTNHRD